MTLSREAQSQSLDVSAPTRCTQHKVGRQYNHVELPMVPVGHSEYLSGLRRQVDFND